MAVGHEEIEVPIAFRVKKEGPPAEVRIAGAPQSGWKGPLVIEAILAGQVEGVRIIFKMGHEDGLSLPAGDIYQLWFVLPDAPVGAALLAPDADGSATLTVEIPDAVALPATMAITVEPAGGVPAPTGDVYLLGQPAK